MLINLNIILIGTRQKEMVKTFFLLLKNLKTKKLTGKNISILLTIKSKTRIYSIYHEFLFLLGRYTIIIYCP